jgi:hypothetical protein
MKGRYQLHPNLAYVDVVIEGRVTLAEMGAFIESVWSDPGWRPDYNGLMDFSGARIELSDQEVLDLTRAMRADPRCSLERWSFVVSRAADFAKLRKLDQEEEKATIRIFFDRGAAEKAGPHRASRPPSVLGSQPPASTGPTSFEPK